MTGIDELHQLTSKFFLLTGLLDEKPNVLSKANEDRALYPVAYRYPGGLQLRLLPFSWENARIAKKMKKNPESVRR
jgi:hypothetical protein